MAQAGVDDLGDALGLPATALEQLVERLGELLRLPVGAPW